MPSVHDRAGLLVQLMTMVRPLLAAMLGLKMLRLWWQLLQCLPLRHRVVSCGLLCRLSLNGERGLLRALCLGWGVRLCVLVPLELQNWMLLSVNMCVGMLVSY